MTGDTGLAASASGTARQHASRTAVWLEAVSPAQRDLDSVNAVITAATQAWALPVRVRRLALPSFLLDKTDLEHMNVLVARTYAGAVAMTAWEASTGQTSGSGSALLHSLYVIPGYQSQGIGTALLAFASRWLAERDFDVITVKAWRQSEGFFRGHGFAALSETGLYPRRMWRAIT